MNHDSFQLISLVQTLLTLQHTKASVLLVALRHKACCCLWFWEWPLLFWKGKTVFVRRMQFSHFWSHNVRMESCAVSSGSAHVSFPLPCGRALLLKVPASSVKGFSVLFGYESLLRSVVQIPRIPEESFDGGTYHSLPALSTLPCSPVTIYKLVQLLPQCFTCSPRLWNPQAARHPLHT